MGQYIKVYGVRDDPSFRTKFYKSWFVETTRREQLTNEYITTEENTAIQHIDKEI